MSKKRTSAEVDNYEQTNEHAVLQQADSAKRVKLIPKSDSTLEDLPIEMVEEILIQTVVMEVMTLRVTKSVWKEKAYLAMNRLSAVCTSWSDSLHSKFLRNQVHRVLDATAQETIRLDSTQETRIRQDAISITSVSREIFVLRYELLHGFFIDVLDRNDTTAVNDVIVIQGSFPEALGGCSLRNTVFVATKVTSNYDILKLSRNENGTFDNTTIVENMPMFMPFLYVTGKGDFFVASKVRSKKPVALIYNEYGSLKQTITLSSDSFKYSKIRSIIEKENGNIMFLIENEENVSMLFEVNRNGRTIRVFDGIIGPQSYASFADSFERVIVVSDSQEALLLDPELRQVDFVGSMAANRCSSLHEVRYDKVLDELMAYKISEHGFLTKPLIYFRCTED